MDRNTVLATIVLVVLVVLIVLAIIWGNRKEKSLKEFRKLPPGEQREILDSKELFRIIGWILAIPLTVLVFYLLVSLISWMWTHPIVFK